jgi:hypothetical protein
VSPASPDTVLSSRPAALESPYSDTPPASRGATSAAAAAAQHGSVSVAVAVAVVGIVVVGGDDGGGCLFRG